MRTKVTELARMNSDQQNKEFAARLREAMLDGGHKAVRAKSGVNATALFRALLNIKGAEITPEMARRYIHGQAKPRDFRMKKIADWLGVNFLWLKDGIGPKHGSSPMDYRDDFERKMIQTWRDGDDRARTAIRNIIDTEANFIDQHRKKKKGD